MRALTWQGNLDVRVTDVPDPRIQQPDTASVRALLLAALTLKDQGGFLVLLDPQPALRKVLALLGAVQAITIRAGAPAVPEET